MQSERPIRIIANSLPKSGTHLLVRFLDLAGFRPDQPNLSGTLVRLTPRNPLRRWLKGQRLWHVGLPDSGLMVDLDDPANKIRSEWLRRLLQKGRAHGFRTAHLPYSQALEAMVLSLDYKILFIIRDPRDVAVSYCNHVLGNPNYPLHKLFAELPSFDERLRIILEGRRLRNGYVLAPLSQRIQHTLGWLESPHVCAIRFEELIGPRGGGSAKGQLSETEKLCRHIGVAANGAECQRIADKIFYPKAMTFHKGDIGQWRNEFAGLTESTRVLFKHTCGNLVVALGYEDDLQWWLHSVPPLPVIPS